MSYRAVLFDFDGVLSKGRFYEKTLLPHYRETYAWIQSNIFDNKELIHKWMRNEINSMDINEIIAKKTGIGYQILNDLYRESVRMMELERETESVARLLKQSGKKIGIVTDNMDIFTEITVPNHHLDTLFDVVINSADHGMLKQDKNGALFNIALAALGEKIEDSLMIDDSESTISLYRKKGGNGLVYKNFTGLKKSLVHL